MAMTWEQRKTLRQEARKNRSFLSREEVRRNSELIINSLRRLNTLNNARVVMGYLAIEKEVDIWPYLSFAWNRVRSWFFPGWRLMTAWW